MPMEGGVSSPPEAVGRKDSFCYSPTDSPVKEKCSHYILPSISLTVFSLAPITLAIFIYLWNYLFYIQLTLACKS